MNAAGEVFVEALRLGLTSFGGPIAHLGYFERAYVERLKWLDARDYASLVALCQILPDDLCLSGEAFVRGCARAAHEVRINGDFADAPAGTKCPDTV